MRIAIYSRKSVSTGKGESIENQVEMCRQYILSHITGAETAEIIIYEDEGFSGKTLDRPQLQKMLRNSQVQTYDYIVCYRLDRISRSVGDFAALIEDLIRRGIAFICIKEQFDTSTPMGRAMMYIASVFAQLERETIAERVRDNMLFLARTGRWLGGSPPTGYQSEKAESCVVEGKVKTSFRLTTNPAEVEAVRMIFEKYLELRSLNGVSRHLLALGVKSRGGAPFSLAGIKDILRNPVYCAADEAARGYFVALGSDVCFTASQCSAQYGLLSYNKRDNARAGAPRQEPSKWIIAMGKHRGIVSGADWVRIQTILAQNRAEPKAYNRYAFLSGQVFCAKCGARMFAKRRSNSAERFDYICAGKLKAGGLCDCQNLSGIQADELVSGWLVKYAGETPDFEKRLRALRQHAQAEASPAPGAVLAAQIQKTRQELNCLLGTLAGAGGGEALARHVGARMEELDAQLQSLTKQKEQAERQSESREAGQKRFRGLARALASLEETVPLMTAHEKRELVRMFIGRMEWDGENLHLFLR